MLTVVSHEYDEETKVDKYVFNPGNMTAYIRVEATDSDPIVYLGVSGMTNEQKYEASKLTWTICMNKEIKEIALADYEARQ